MLLSTLSFAFMNAIVKYLVNFSTFQLVFFRSIGSLLITYSFLKSQGIPQWGNQKKLLILRSLVGVTSMILFFWGLHYISMGSAVTLRYISPIFAALLAVVFLKEVIKPIQWIFFFMAFVGVFLIKSFDSSGSSFGVLLSLIGCFFFCHCVHFNCKNWKWRPPRSCCSLLYVTRYSCWRNWKFFFLEDPFW